MDGWNSHKQYHKEERRRLYNKHIRRKVNTLKDICLEVFLNNKIEFDIKTIPNELTNDVLKDNNFFLCFECKKKYYKDRYYLDGQSPYFSTHCKKTIIKIKEFDYYGKKWN